MFETDSFYSGQSLLQTGATLLQKEKVATIWGNYCCKQGSSVLLQSGTRTITKWGWPVVRKWDNFIKKWVKYYKKRELLQSRQLS